MKYIIALLFLCSTMISCKQTPLQKKIDEYCDCVEKISAMDYYDSEHTGKITIKKAEALSSEISVSLGQEGFEKDDLKKYRDCMEKNRENSERWIKELDTGIRD